MNLSPTLLIVLALAALLPLFNGKTLLQILLDMLIPKPAPTSAQAWDFYQTKAREALEKGQTETAKLYSQRAAEVSAEYREQEMQFSPQGILQWLMSLITGGAGGGMLPLLIVAGVAFLMMGGCPKDLPEVDAADQAVLYEAPYLEPSVPIDPEPVVANETEVVPSAAPPIVAAPAAAIAVAVVRSGPIRRLFANRPLRSWIASRPLKRLLCRR
jgi:hypothetical protein